MPFSERFLLALPLRHREELASAKALTPDEDREALFLFLKDKTEAKVKGCELIPLPQCDFKVIIDDDNTVELIGV